MMTKKILTVQDLVVELMKFPINAAVVIEKGKKLFPPKLLCGHGIKRIGEQQEIVHKQYELRHEAKVVLIVPEEEENIVEKNESSE